MSLLQLSALAFPSAALLTQVEEFAAPHREPLAPTHVPTWGQGWHNYAQRQVTNQAFLQGEQKGTVTGEAPKTQKPANKVVLA